MQGLGKRISLAVLCALLLWGCGEPACGNGIIQADEQCDDGNTVNGDGCD